MKHRTVRLVIKTELSNKEVLEIFDNGTQNLKDLGIQLEELNVVGSADSIIKGIDYSN